MGRPGRRWTWRRRSRHRTPGPAGTSYEAYVGRWSRQVAREFVAGSAPRRRRWLDVGCGTGAVTPAVLELAAGRGRRGRSVGRLPRRAAATVADPRASFQGATPSTCPRTRRSTPSSRAGAQLRARPAGALAAMRRAAPGGGRRRLRLGLRRGHEFMRHFWDAAVASTRRPPATTRAPASRSAGPARCATLSPARAWTTWSSSRSTYPRSSPTSTTTGRRSSVAPVRRRPTSRRCRRRQSDALARRAAGDLPIRPDGRSR